MRLNALFQLDALLLKILVMVLKVTEEDENFTRDYRGFYSWLVALL